MRQRAHSARKRINEKVVDVKLSLDFVFCAEVISHVTFFPGFARQDLFENAELATNEAQSDQQPTCESPSVFRKQSKRIAHHPESTLSTT